MRPETERGLIEGLSMKNNAKHDRTQCTAIMAANENIEILRCHLVPTSLDLLS